MQNQGNLSLAAFDWWQLHRLLLFALVTMAIWVLGAVSIGFNTWTGQMPVLWLPNAFVIAALIQTDRKDFAGLVLAHATGVFLGNAVWGTAFWLSIGFVLVNAAEVGIAAYVMRRLLVIDRPHETEQSYLAFALLATLPDVLLTASAGGLLIEQAYGVPFWTAYASWIVGDSISLIGFVPLFLLVRRNGLPAHTLIKRRQVLAALALLGFTFLILQAAAVSGSDVEVFHVVVPFLAISALVMGPTGTIIASGLLAPVIAASSRLTGQAIYDPGLENDGLKALAFGVLWFSAVIPSNLISVMVERLRIAEQTQRDISTMKTKFMSTISHEIRTPMNAIHGMFELFHRSAQSEKQTSWAKAGLSASSIMQVQVTQLLQMARLEENVVVTAKIEVDLAETVAMWKTAAQATLLAHDKNVGVTTAVAKEAPEKPVLDLARVNQIMINLLSNAAKFSTGGTITIGADVVGDDLRLWVADQGIGLRKGDQKKVFGRYWRSERLTANHGPSTGLGLSISQDIATQIGGTLRVESTYGEGSTFTLSLPLVTI